MASEQQVASPASEPQSSTRDHPQPSMNRASIVIPPASVICIDEPSSPNINAAAPDRSCSGRMERKIRGLKDTYYGWFRSSGPVPIGFPCVNGADAQENDVFVHIHGTGERQIWLKGLRDFWQPIQCGHIHPSLPSYRLIVNVNGEPRWVTRQTMVTYASRGKAG
jgi:hypothetical protein